MGWYKNQLCFQICMICPVLPLQYHFVATFIPIFNSTRVYQLSFNLLKSLSSFPLQCFTLCCPSSRSTLPLCLVPNLVLLIIKVQTIMIIPLRVLYWTLVTPIHIFIVQSLSYVQLFVSTAGFPVLHHLLELDQTHFHWISESIQPSHPLFVLSPFPPAFNLSQHQGLFLESQPFVIRWPKYRSFSFSISPANEYSGLISFRIDCLISLQSISTVFSNTTGQKQQFFDPQPSL